LLAVLGACPIYKIILNYIHKHTHIIKLYLYMGHAPSTANNSCWVGATPSCFAAFVSGAHFPPPANGIHKKPSALAPEASASCISFKDRRLRRFQDESQLEEKYHHGTLTKSDSGFIEVDPRLEITTPRVDLVGKIAMVLFQHVNFRVFSHPEDDPWHVKSFTTQYFPCIKRHTHYSVRKEDIVALLTLLMDGLGLVEELVVLACIYTERLLGTRKAVLTPANWDCILVTGIILASKVWEDIHPWNVDFAAVLTGWRTPFSSFSIYKMESLFLKQLEFKVQVDADCYAAYYFNFTQKTNPLETLGIIDEEDSPTHARSGPVESLNLFASVITLPSIAGGFGRLDPRNPYVGTFQHARPAENPSHSFLSGDLCKCNFSGTCHVCVRRTKKQIERNDASSMRRVRSWASSMSTEAESCVPSSHSPSLNSCVEVSPKTTNASTLTGASGRYLAAELKRKANVEMNTQETIRSLLRPSPPPRVRSKIESVHTGLQGITFAPL